MFQKRHDAIFLVGLGALWVAGCTETVTELTCDPGKEFDSLTEQCVRVLANCQEGDPKSILPECQDLDRECYEDDIGALCGVCRVGFTDEEAASAGAGGGTGGDNDAPLTACRAVLLCADLGCAAQNRICEAEGDRFDARCDECVEGTSEDEGECVPPSCDPTVLGSIFQECADMRRACVDDDGVRCGDCWPGYLEEYGGCRGVVTCADLDCAGADRLCTLEGDHSDAACGACRGGTVDDGGQCVTLETAVCAGGDPNSILAACEAEHRECVDATGGAVCGACAADYIEYVDLNQCVAVVACGALDCAAQNRACEPEPTGHCTDCLDFFIEEAAIGLCRPVLTCADVADTCPVGEECMAETVETDAFCAPDCGDDAIWGGYRCAPCPPCDGIGEVDRWPFPSASGECICQTEAGYFYSLSAEVGAFLCDADLDGWVRESARTAINSDDAALLTNARCDLRTIDRFVLVNEGQQTRTVELDQPLDLFESDRNDNDAVLDLIWEQRSLPAYGTGGRRIGAKELNRLTKLCHEPRTDYNDNGVPDVEEYDIRPLSPGFRPDQRPFNEFSYFAELYWGWYTGPVGDATYGTYTIQEKVRPQVGETPSAQSVPIGYDPVEDDSFWRECVVYRDSDWEIAQPVGMDFAWTSDDPPGADWAGMNHHSQFKCVVVEDDPDPENPNELRLDQIVSGQLRVNDCAAGASVEHDLNPSEIPVSCSLVDPTVAGAVEPGDVYWTAVPFIDYGPWLDTTYVRGCRNVCADEVHNCPGWDINPAAVGCLYDAEKFGIMLTDGCTLREVCDGLDNDGDGTADNGNPDAGLACESTEIGVCKLGTTACVPTPGCFTDNPLNPTCIVCEPNVAPQSQPELCNLLDDDCDGAVDEGDTIYGAEGNLECEAISVSVDPVTGDVTETPLLGICGVGTTKCVGGEIECQVNTIPGEVMETCNGLDDDCDGDPDNLPFGALPTGVEGTCLFYHRDEDNDGYGLQLDYKCQCGPEGHYKILGQDDGGPTAWDCCDTNATASPDYGADGDFQTEGTGCSISGDNLAGPYDWNCDGEAEMEYDGVTLEGCGYNWGAARCDPPNTGFANYTMCGQSGSFYHWHPNDGDGCDNTPICDQMSIDKVQACR